MKEIKTINDIGGSNALTPKDDVMIRLPERFSVINGMIARDLNQNAYDRDRDDDHNTFVHTKEKIMKYLKNPRKNERNLRNAVIYLYWVSSHFRRLIQYFVSLNDLSYVISPHKLEPTSTSQKSVLRNYKRTLNLVSSMDLKNQGEKILTVCLREDVFYGTIREQGDSTMIQQLPSDYCSIATVENNVLNVLFDFSYFDRRPRLLRYYPEEFTAKYNEYVNAKRARRWRELDAPNSFAIKCNKDILAYAMPPFAGILREIYDIEDYKQLKMTKTELENYAMLVMTLGVNEDGEWQMDLQKAKEFWRNLDSVLPEEIGSVLTPMPINKISFERNHNGDADTISEAEQNLFTAAGVSSLLFNNPKATAAALLLSIKADQAMTFSIVKSIETALNRFIQHHGFGRYFKITFLDCSPFNRKEMGDAYLKAAQFGLPTLSYYAASQGLPQEELDGMNYLEDDILGLKERFVPLRSSSTMSSDSGGATDEGGRPRLSDGELSESGELSREREEG